MEQIVTDSSFRGAAGLFSYSAEERLVVEEGEFLLEEPRARWTEEQIREGLALTCSYIKEGRATLALELFLKLEKNLKSESHDFFILLQEQVNQLHAPLRSELEALRVPVYSLVAQEALTWLRRDIHDGMGVAMMRLENARKKTEEAALQGVWADTMLHELELLRPLALKADEDYRQRFEKALSE